MSFALLIPIAFFAMVAYIVKMGIDHSKWKATLVAGGSGDDKSLGTKELQRLIREAVEEAQAPLHERMQALEARLEDRGAAQPLLTGWEEEADLLEPNLAGRKQRVT